MQNKNTLIQAILTRSKTELRKATGIYNGKPVLAYIDDSQLLTYDVKGNPINVDFPGHSIEEREKFFLDYNIILFSGYRELRKFIDSGKPAPKHEYTGLPPWSWIIKNELICFDG